MPRSLSASMISYIGRQAGRASIALLDIQTVDGTHYFLSDFDGTYPSYVLSLLDPSAFDTANWIKSSSPAVTVTPNATAAPDGTTTADQINFAATGVSQFASIAQDLTTNVSGIRFTFLIWLKAAAATTIVLSVRPIPITVQNDVIMNVGTAWQQFSASVFVPFGTTATTFEVEMYNAPSSSARSVFAWGAELRIDYSSWLKQVGPITLTRNFTTDAGDIVLQNLSGNTIDRDVASAIKAHEFEGALGVLRLWLPLFDDKMFQFHGYLSEQQPGEEEATFRLLQLSDYTQYNIAEDVFTDLCTWRYKSAQCGSTGTATSCNKRLIDCQDATRAAQERFNGILLVPPAGALVNPPPVQTTPGPRGGAGAGSASNGGGSRGRLATF